MLGSSRNSGVFEGPTPPSDIMAEKGGLGLLAFKVTK
jgi:hypothetical protein